MPNVRAYLREDLGAHGDVTTQALFGTTKRRIRARVFTRQRIVAAGILEAADTFATLGVKATPRVVEGSWVPQGATLLELTGPLTGVLSAERVALNLLGRMSGIATQTRRLQDAVSRINPACRVAGTRKTTPGFRAEEKRAILLGGGDPHRWGLFDAILIKDNHLAGLGSVRAAVQRAKKARPNLPIEVEVSTARDAREAARAGVHWILIDNLTPSQARSVAAAARNVNPNLHVECSGGLTPENLTRYASFSGRLSLGALTHSAHSADVSLEFVDVRSANP